MSRETKAKSAVLRIFNLPPSSSAELKQILSGVDVEYVREEIFEQVEDGIFGEADFAIFAEVIQEIGVGSHREQLVKLVLDEECDVLARKYALVALTQDANDELIAELGHLGPEVLQNLTDLPFIDLLCRLQMDPDEASQVTQLLESSEPESREYVFWGLEKIRNELGIPATFVYADVLTNEELSEIYPPILEAIVSEASEDGLQLLTRRRDASENNESWQLFQKALLRLGTRNIETENPPKLQKGIAYLGSCDGQGAYLLIGRFRISRRNTTTVHVCIRCSGDIRDSFVLPMLDDKEFKEILSKHFIESPGEFVEISLDQAGIFVEESLERMAECGVKLDKRDRYAIDLFRRLDEGCDLPWLDSSILSKEKVREKFAALLGDPLFESWFLDLGDFFGYGIKPPEGLVTEEWYQAAATRLGETPIRERLLGMARHMARFYLLMPDLEKAQMFAYVYEEARENFVQSTLLRSILKKTVEEVYPAGDALASLDAPMGFGDTDLRRLIRTEFFSKLKRPLGIHLARLDFTEVAFHGLEPAFLVLPGERRPREQSKYAIANAIGRTFTNIVVKHQGERLDSDVAKLARRVSKLANITIEESESIVSASFENLISFYDDICSRCPVGCVSRHSARMNNHFYALAHPAEELFDKADGSLESDEHYVSDDDGDDLLDWVSVEQETQQGEDELCSCGSGKKYGKCCKFN